MDIGERVDRLEEKVNKIETDIQADIREIKTMLKEKNTQEDLKNSLLNKDILEHEKRLKKIENNFSWMSKTIVTEIISIVIALIVCGIKNMPQ